jgi:hypothetical protein
MILSKNRLFAKVEPDRDAKSLYIFCEGVKREKEYFNYFKEIDSRINIEVYDLKPQENNSPSGLFKIAETYIQTRKNPKGKYELIENDQVWIVIDRDYDKADSRGPQIKQLKADCEDRNWSVCQSNPCFEVWLHYHFYLEKPNLQNPDKCSEWKQYVNKVIGGFNSKKHPLFIQTALENAKTNFQYDDNEFPIVSSTDVFRLAESILSVGSIKQKIQIELKKLEK